jgi:hypothetical protein
VAIKNAYGAYCQRMGGEPTPAVEPSLEQIAAAAHIVNKLDKSPFVCFGVFGPHAARTQRKLKFRGMIQQPNGQFVMTEMAGPGDIDQWLACYAVFRTTCIMLDIIRPSALDNYRDHITRMAKYYTATCWPLIYQADTRARRELAERLRRHGQAELDALLMAAQATGGSPVHAFDPTMPWEWVWQQIPLQDSFWKVEIENPGIMLMARISPGGGTEFTVSGEAPVANFPGDSAPAPFHRGARGGRKKQEERQNPYKGV